MNAEFGEKERPLAFVIMPFDEEFKSIFHQLLVPPLQEAGFRVRRADSSFEQENILKGIIRGIGESDVVVADLTTLNPNVLYELGLAHGLQKATILVAQSIDDIPFDLRPYRANIYSLDFREVEAFKERLRDVAARLLSAEARSSNPVTDFLVLAGGRTPREPGETEAPLTSQEEQGEPGLLDWRVDLEEGAQEAVGSLLNMQRAMERMSERIGGRAQEMQDAKSAANPGAASRLKVIATAAAHDILEYVRVAEAELPTYRGAWERYAESTASLLLSPLGRDPEQRESLLELRGSVAQALDSVDHATDALSQLRGSIRSIRGISRDLNFAAERLSRTIDNVRTEFETSKASLAKIVGLLDDLLKEPPP